MRRQYLPNGDHYLVIRASRQVTSFSGMEFAEVIVDRASPVSLTFQPRERVHSKHFSAPWPPPAPQALGTYSILLRLDGLGFGTLELEDLLRRAGVKIPSFEGYWECRAWIRSTLQSSALVGRRVRVEARKRTSKMGKPMQVRKYTQV